MDEPRVLDAGRVPRRIARGFSALSERAGATYAAVVAREGLVGGALGAGAGLGAGVVLWQSFWHGLLEHGVAIGAATGLAAVLLMVPFRAVAGAFATTLTLALTALAALFFVDSPPGVHAASAVTPAAPLAEDVAALAEAGQVSGLDASEVLPGAEAGAVPVDPASSTASGFGHAVFHAPVAGRPGWEPATPCHSRERTWPGHGDDQDSPAKGPCELRASTQE